jgi:hypothetical protein
MDFSKAFTYVFEDPNWIMKVLIGGIVLLIPIVNFAAFGYMLTTMKNIADGQPQPLPEWGAFGDHFMKGLYAVVGVFVYLLPGILVICCGNILTAVVGGGASAIGGRQAGNAIGGIVSLVALCLSCVAYLYIFIASLTMYAPLTRFAMSANQLSLFWDFRGNLDLITKNLGNYVMALIISWVAVFVGYFGLILCIIGVVFTLFWAYLVISSAFAQFWQQAQAQGTLPAMA